MTTANSGAVTPGSKTPIPVAVAVWMVGISMGLGFALFELSESVPIKGSSREITTIIWGGLVFMLLRAVFRRKQWARIVLLELLLLSFIGGWEAVDAHSGFQKARVIVQLTLELVTFSLLVLPVSSAWFRER